MKTIIEEVQEIHIYVNEKGYVAILQKNTDSDDLITLPQRNLRTVIEALEAIEQGK